MKSEIKGKSPSAKAKGLGMVWLPLVDSKIFLSKPQLSNKMHKSIYSEGEKIGPFPGRLLTFNSEK